MKKEAAKSRYNAKNERAKHKYRQHLRCIGQRDEKTIISSLRHIRDFETFINFAGFEIYNEQVADAYIQNMLNDKKSLNYISGNIHALKEFLRWLERQHGYRSKINYCHIDYLNISTNQRKESKAMEYKKSHKFERIIEVIRKMPDTTEKEKRDKAMISLQALCTLRVSELRTVKIKNVIEEDGMYFIYACPKTMETKFAKTRHVSFVALPEDIKENVLSWLTYLQKMGFKDKDPLFPSIPSQFAQTNLLESKIKKEGIKSNTTIRNVFEKAFESAGYEYLNPHSFRHTLARYAETQNPAFLNAVKQNLGHSSIDTTLSSYGQLSVAEQRRIINQATFSH